MQLDQITIDPELESLNRSLTEEERSELMRSIERDGFRDPLVVWKGEGALLDGHNRFELWQTIYRDDPQRQPSIEEVEVKDHEEARQWIARNQLGRRNCTRQEYAYLIGVLYNSRKTTGHGAKSGDQFDTQNTAAQVAAETGVSEPTVKRSGRYNQSVDTIGQNVGPEAKAEILSGESKLSQQAVNEIASQPAEDQRHAYEQAKAYQPAQPRREVKEPETPTARDDGDGKYDTKQQHRSIQGIRNKVKNEAANWPDEEKFRLRNELVNLSDEVME